MALAAPYRKGLAALGIALLAALAAWIVGLASPVKALEGRTLDWRLHFRGPQGARSNDIVLVLIDEDADLDYRSPVPRLHLAQILEALGQARLIGLDILLDKPSFDRQGDTRLRQVLEKNGNVIGVSYIEDGREQLPHPYFAEAMLDFGFATFTTGAEVEVVRHGKLVRRTAEGLSLSLAGCLYAHARGVQTGAVRLGKSGELSEEEMLINFSGPPNAVYRRVQGLAGGFTICRSHQVTGGVYPAAFFKDKIVLVGSGLTDAPDRFRTPYFTRQYGYEKMLGVEVHAHFLRTLLEDSQLQRWGRKSSTAFLVFCCLAIAVAVLYGGAFKSAVGLLILLGGWWGGAFALFNQGNVVVALVVPSLGLMNSYGMALAYHTLTEGREKREIRLLFEKYLAPDVVQHLLEDPGSWELGGRNMELTVMFADLEGFTPLSEQLEPKALVHLVNEFLTEMSSIILQQEGTIDKYEGDLIMAFFGAPLPLEDHAQRACRAALAMQVRMEQLRDQWKRQGLPELRVRIGLHSGLAVVGNMGSDFRFNYTAMGDTVNLASRLEGANKDFGTYTLISNTTRKQAGEQEFAYRNLGEIQVKGKSEMTAVYELLPVASA